MAEQKGWEQKQAGKRDASPNERREVRGEDRDSASRAADRSMSDGMTGERGIDEKGLDAPARELDEADETPRKPLTDNG